MDARYGWHSLIAAYGISADKVIFIPHGVNIPKSSAPSQRHLTAIDHFDSKDTVRVRELLAKAGKLIPVWSICHCGMSAEDPEVEAKVALCTSDNNLLTCYLANQA